MDMPKITEDRKITVKDVYLKLLLLEIKMDTTVSGIRTDLSRTTSHFDRWLWAMVILNVVQILIHAMDIL